MGAVTKGDEYLLLNARWRFCNYTSLCSIHVMVRWECGLLVAAVVRGGGGGWRRVVVSVGVSRFVGVAEAEVLQALRRTVII